MKTETELIRAEYTFSSPGPSHVLLLENIHGSIEVEGYDGESVVLEVLKTVETMQEGRIPQAFQELAIGKEERGDTLEIFLDFPWETNSLEQIRNESGMRLGRINGTYYLGDKHWKPDYEFRMDFRLKVPRQLHLSLSTVDEGRIVVQKVRGELVLEVIHGDIDIRDGQGKTSAKTIHGDIEAEYQRSPQETCEFATHKGDIRTTFPTGMAAQMLFSAYQGDFFTNLPELELKQQSTKSVQAPGKSGDGTRYLLSRQPLLTSRKGNLLLRYETYHGDVYVLEQ